MPLFQSVPDVLTVKDVNVRIALQALKANDQVLINEFNKSSTTISDLGDTKRIIQYQVKGAKSIGVHPLQVQLPKGSVITNAWYDVISTVTAGATLALGVDSDSPAGILAAVSAGTGFTIGLFDAIPDNTATNMIKTTDKRSIILTVSVAPITEGSFNLFLEVTPSVA